MTTAQWFVLVGGLLLFMGLTTTILKRSPFTAAIIYLMVGLVVGPSGFNLFHFNPLNGSALLEVLTEVAVLISLFAAGVKMPVPFSWKRWTTPVLLATVAMTLTVGMVAGYGMYVLSLPLGAAILLGAILAPTDPVLASDIQDSNPGHHVRIRFTLACEAGMNDGTAFPFVMLGLGLLGLHELGDHGLRWVLVDVLWATTAGVVIGCVAGMLLGRLGWKLRREPYRHELMDDFIGLGLIGFVYGLSVMLSAWGFLAVFFAAVALRQTEQKLANTAAISSSESTMVETGLKADTVIADPFAELESTLTVSEGSLIFKEHLERLSVLLLILLLGGTLFINSWTWEAVGLSLFLFIIARPLSVQVCQLGSTAPWRVRAITGWFGVRGIGSLYYLMYAIQHGLPEALAMQLIQLTLIVVTLSIVLHGISVKPIFALGKQE
ncbi:MAG: cation:proton antiporter [Pseudohongiellaceae bacterium]